MTPLMYCYRRDMSLAYIGLSFPKTDWATMIAAVKVIWHPDKEAALRAKIQEIAKLKPTYNLPTSIAADKRAYVSVSRTRGDGLACPRCGNQKERRHNAYCHACMRVYQRQRRISRMTASGELP